MAEPTEKRSVAPSLESASEKRSLFSLFTSRWLQLAVGSLFALGALGTAQGLAHQLARPFRKAENQHDDCGECGCIHPQQT